MNLSEKIFFGYALFLGFFWAQEPISEKNFWDRLKAGNERFVSGKLQEKSLQDDRIHWKDSQQPYAIILTCADSRVPPELIFDESLGRLFVIRVAGNVVSAEVLGSIEYAAEHLQSPCLLVLGHEGCGAVKAALQKGKTSRWIHSLIKRIRPAVKKFSEQDLGKAVQANVEHQFHRLSQSLILKELVEHHQLQVFGGVYSFQTGKVELLQHQPSLKESHVQKSKSPHTTDLPKKIRI